MEFEQLFREATQDPEGGKAPFPYQSCLATSRELPWLLHVPTGAGKTAAAVLGWLFRRRFHPDPEVRAATPRRLVYCLPMRVLVEQTVRVAREWVGALGKAASGIQVYQLMGGEIDRDWDRSPERDAILVGTQDQLLSRALNRGYAMSRYRWPICFAFLNSDALWAMDEVQLMGPGLKTTAQLQAFRKAFATYGPTHSLWMSATMRPEDLRTVDLSPAEGELEARSLALSEADYSDPILATRLRAEKPLAAAPVSLTKETRGKYARDLAGAVADAHQPGTLTLLIVNQVRRAQQAFSALKKLDRSGDGPELLLLHSRFRPAERSALEERRQEDVPEEGPGRIVVATQAIEAGVDLSARAMFTELSPWSSLVQRFGRCNREGEWGGDQPAQVQWIDVRTDHEPYEEADLDAARELLAGLRDAGIEAVHTIEDPQQAPVSHVVRKRDLVDLFDTTPDLAGNDLDVSPYIREADDLDVQVFWRDLGEDVDVQDQPAPRPEELCGVRLPVFRRFMAKLDRALRPLVWDGLEKQWDRCEDHRLRPGLTLLLDTAAGGYDAELGWNDAGKRQEPVVPVASPQDGPSGAEGHADDPATPLGSFISLTEHTDHVVAELEALCDQLPDLDPSDREALLLAARWHDAGKAHAAFQARLTAGLDEADPRREGTAWAKAPRDVYGDGVGERPHFRHELASALAMVQVGLPDLAAYLAAAHHGKVRLSIRSLPGEKPPEDQPDTRFARGLFEGDILPVTELGEGVSMPETTLCLALMELGESEAGPSWLARSLALRDGLGPFRLAWLEAVLRIADWRASEEEGKQHD